MYPRNATARLAAALADTPVVLIHGARQTGKTTLARAADASFQYATLDDAATLAAASTDPRAFLAGLGPRIVLDEIQRAPALFPAMKVEVDERRSPGRFLLTGSANVMLLPKVSESLAGRIEIIPLWPLSQGELGGVVETFIDRAFAPRWTSRAVPSLPPQALLDRVLRGGYPEAVRRADPQRRAAWFASYITSILERDVRNISDIAGLVDLPRLLTLLASRAAGLLNFADLSRSLSIPQTTLKRYFVLLQAIFQIVELPAWSSNRGLRLSKSPKVILSDTGLASHLLNLDADRLASDGAARGALLENFVAMELLKQSGWSKAAPRLHHFRTSAGQEVDLVLEDRGGRVVGVETKSASAVDDKDFRGLRSLADAAGSKFVRGFVLYTGPQPLSFGPDLHALPVQSLWAPA